MAETQELRCTCCPKGHKVKMAERRDDVLEVKSRSHGKLHTLRVKLDNAQDVGVESDP